MERKLLPLAPCTETLMVLVRARIKRECEAAAMPKLKPAPARREAFPFAVGAETWSVLTLCEYADIALALEA